MLTTDDYRVQVQPVAFTTKKADASQERAIRETNATSIRDMGRVIGKQGRTARAVRSLLATLAARENRRSRLEIVE